MSNAAIQLAGQQTAPARVDTSVRFTQEQERVILETCCGGASPSEARALIAIAEARGLNPILGECYFVKRYDTKAGRDVWAVQASIDSFRIKAEQTGLYAGQDEPEYEHDAEGFIVLARVRVYRKDWPRPSVGIARWSEYAQTTKDGTPTKFWKQMPYNQLAKCAEALAIRKAFPAVLAQIYTSDEMQQADNESPTDAPRSAPRQMTAPAPVQIDERAFAELCERVDAAERSAQLNSVANDAVKAVKAGKITRENVETLRIAVLDKRKRIVEEKSAPKSAPSMPESDRGDAYEESES